MKLRYSSHSVADRALVLERGQRRAELHLQDVGELWLVVGLAGMATSAPELEKCQGPYADRNLAAGVRNAIAAALSERGFMPEAAEPVWLFRARAVALAVASERADNAVATEFDPLTDLY